MVVRPYAVLTLPAKDTVLGGLSTLGCRVELVARPHQDEALGSCYAIAFTVEGIEAAAAAEAEGQLLEAHACLVKSRLDAGRRTWDVSMWIPVQNVRTLTFRLLEQAPEGTAPAWVVFEQGLAQVRLRPRRGPIDGFLYALLHCMRRYGVDAEVVVMDLDDERHVQRVEALDAMPQPLLA